MKKLFISYFCLLVFAVSCFGQAYSLSGPQVLAKHVTGAGGETSFTFSSIPAGFNNLRVVMQLRSDNSSAPAVRLTVNGDSGTNYLWQRIAGNNATGFGDNQGGSPVAFVNMGSIPGTDSTTGAASDFIINVPNYSGTTFWKVCFVYGAVTVNNASWVSSQVSGTWKNTGAVTSLTVTCTAGNIIPGSTAVLFGE